MSIILGESDESKVENPKFRLCAKNLFLTYPQCGNDIELVDFKDWICNLGRSLDIGGGACCVERHEDGGFHIHCFLRLNRKCDIRSTTFLDYNGLHGNYAPARKPREAYLYVGKDPVQYLEWGEIDLSDVIKKEVIACKSKLAVMEVMIKHNKIFQAKFWSEYWEIEKAQRRTGAEVRPITEFNVPFEITLWMEGMPAPVTSCVLIGASGIGKTSLARAMGQSLGSPFWATTLNSLKLYNGEKVIIFDDIGLGNMNRENIISLMDVENLQDIRVLFGIVSIPAGTRRIFSCNSLQNLLGDKIEDDAIRRRMSEVYFDEPLFGARSVAPDLRNQRR